MNPGNVDWDQMGENYRSEAAEGFQDQREELAQQAEEAIPFEIPEEGEDA